MTVSGSVLRVRVDLDLLRIDSPEPPIRPKVNSESHGEVLHQPLAVKITGIKSLNQTSVVPPQRKSKHFDDARPVSRAE